MARPPGQRRKQVRTARCIARIPDGRKHRAVPTTSNVLLALDGQPGCERQEIPHLPFHTADLEMVVEIGMMFMWRIVVHCSDLFAHEEGRRGV